MVKFEPNRRRQYGPGIERGYSLRAGELTAVWEVAGHQSHAQLLQALLVQLRLLPFWLDRQARDGCRRVRRRHAGVRRCRR